MRWKGRLRGAFAAIAMLIVFFFLARALLRNWQEIPFGEIQFDLKLVVLSYCCMFAYFSVSAFAWKYLIRVCGGKLSFGRSWQVLATSQLGKYVPGKVWFALGRIYLADRSGVPKRVTLLSIILETVLLLITGGALGLLTVVSPLTESPVLRVSAAFVILLVGLLLLHPRVFRRCVDWLMKRLKREAVDVNLTYSGILILIMIYCACWFWPGLGFFLLVKSFYDVEVARWSAFLGIFAVAWLAGFVSLVTPSGLGVREGIMSSLLAIYMPVSMAVIVALVARLWATVAEGVFFLVSAPAVRAWGPQKTRAGRI
jgi:hypothetical protein